MGDRSCTRGLPHELTFPLLHRRRRHSDYVTAARKVTGRSGRTGAGSAPERGNSEELAKSREWMNANGHEVSSRGCISQAVRDAYDAPH
ncbi:Lsr2 family protein [Curtobacterium flaccumfaciens]|uniref:Lsr2 family DNA-binding protein n=1 Tax=Curtobacterium flaccumfaciens TaxID=2035 RepID=UPI00188D46AF|nr:histone-like nucleoid-structuring protein Lsr2 [Curtobacterium flaccumfaciens]MBF4595696.1 Lsr2 family protein [Curtobacterium flaccumfaciens]